MNPAQTYDAMTDAELIDFVAARLPGLLWRVDHKPRCWICREAIIDELARHPMFEPLDKRHA